MSEFIVKICGITRAEDGIAALAAGADWLGFIRWSGSKRYRPIEACARVLSEIRSGAEKPFEAVAVYVDQSASKIEREADAAGFDRIQLHGSEPPEFVRSLRLPAIKTIKVRPGEIESEADRYPEIPLLADTEVPGLPGGTGRGYDVALLSDLASRRRLIVAGGLHTGNVGEIIERLQPYGVDVSSGVETAPGIKDDAKLRLFISAAKAASVISESLKAE